MTKSKQTGRTDDQIEKFIFSEIKRKGITFNDMISIMGAVDPDPDNKETDSRDRARTNRFTSLSEDARMMELLADVDCRYLDHFPPLRISLQDLFRFWWNRCVDQGLVVEMLMEDIFSYFMEKMRPVAEEPEQLDMTVDFSKLPLSLKNIKEAA